MDETNDVINQPTEQVEQPIEQPQTTEKPDETLSTLINELTEKYEARISAITTKYNASIAERDDVIKQLLTGETVQEQTIADRINARRTYKKW